MLFAWKSVRAEGFALEVSRVEVVHFRVICSVASRQQGQVKELCSSAVHTWARLGASIFFRRSDDKGIGSRA